MVICIGLDWTFNGGSQIPGISDLPPSYTATMISELQDQSVGIVQIKNQNSLPSYNQFHISPYSKRSLSPPNPPLQTWLLPYLSIRNIITVRNNVSDTLPIARACIVNTVLTNHAVLFIIVSSLPPETWWEKWISIGTSDILNLHYPMESGNRIRHIW